MRQEAVGLLTRVAFIPHLDRHGKHLGQTPGEAARAHRRFTLAAVGRQRQAHDHRDDPAFGDQLRQEIEQRTIAALDMGLQRKGERRVRIADGDSDAARTVVDAQVDGHGVTRGRLRGRAT